MVFLMSSYLGEHLLSFVNLYCNMLGWAHTCLKLSYRLVPVNYLQKKHVSECKVHIIHSQEPKHHSCKYKANFSKLLDSYNKEFLLQS